MISAIQIWVGMTLMFASAFGLGFLVGYRLAERERRMKSEDPKQE